MKTGQLALRFASPEEKAGRGGARVFTIPAGVPFLDALAEGVLARAGGEPLALSRVTVLLPTRRACRALRDAFLRRTGGRPTLLPRLRPIGDVDDDELALTADEGGLDLPPSIGPLRRLVMLAHAILKLDPEETAPRAVDLAAELAHLLDQVQTEQLDFSGLEKLAPDDYAEHWRRTVKFLAILTENWPKILGTEGAIDPVERRNRVLKQLAARWRAQPAPDPVYAAGSTGSIPAVADLMGVIARLPQGAVVLPGLDRDLDGGSWDELDETHPQFGLKRLLGRLEVSRETVRDWAYGAASPHAAARRRLLSVALRPAATTGTWQELTALPALPAEAVDGLSRIDCAHPQQEAQVIALLLRDALETEGRTAALITPDRDLARRVAAEIARFGVAVDDSAGRPLAATPPLAYLRLLAEVMCDGAAPAPLLALLKHPLAAGGLVPVEFRNRARRLELAVLHGPRPGRGLASLIAELRGGKDEDLVPWLAGLAEQARPFAEAGGGTASVLDLVRAHVAVAEAWAATGSEAGPARLWAGEAGEAAANFIAELADAARDFPPIHGSAYPAFFSACAAGRVVRPAWGGHPRLQILGPLEARLIGVDLAILGGLNEGTWPPEAAADPWMSRPMRGAFGLPAPERRIGLSAHDFAQACGAPEVVLTRALRVEGTPSVPSRWLQRLDAVLNATGLRHRLDRPAPLAWRAWFDRTELQTPPGPPAPRPPLAARPRRLSVTQIETWRRDPYAIYARHVLRLKKLDPIDADPGAADRGTVIHDALAEFVRAHPKELPADALDRLLAIGERRFGALLARPGIWAFWWPRFRAIAGWFVGHEREWRREALPAATEVGGVLALAAGAGEFRLTARADRIDRLADGGLAIVDYKTGGVPGDKDVVAGFAPQLPLEAAIAAAGGFDGLTAAPVSQLRYWRLTGGEPPGEDAALDGAGEPAALAAQALEGLRALIARFDDPATPYHARPWPDQALRYNDYAHLARIKEWSATEDER